MSMTDATFDRKAAPRSVAALDASPPGAAEAVETLIRSRRGWVGLDWAELWRCRELLYFFVWRDVKVRYKQTALGFAWALLQPLMMMAIFTFLFGRVARIPSEGLPYAAFVFAGLLPWTFFSAGVSAGGLSLLNQRQLLTKIYFPRLFVPTGAVGALLVDLLISLGLYAVVLASYAIVPPWTVVFVPLLLAQTVVLTLGLAYLLAALTVLYRDFRYLIPFGLQVLMYLSPVIYPTTLLPKRFQLVLMLNPMFGIIEGLRSAILGTPWNLPALGLSAVVSLILLVVGAAVFRRTERRFADIA